MIIESNSTTGPDVIHELSIINVDMLFNLTEADYSAWAFYEDALYESAISLGNSLPVKRSGAK